MIVLSENNKKELKKIFYKNKEKVIKLYNPLNVEEIKKLSLDKNLLTKEEKELLNKKYFLEYFPIL